MENNSNNVHSENIKAGKRTYFLDIKSSRDKETFYLVISESRKSFDEDGTASFQKSRIFIYPEDINRFEKAITTAKDQLKELMPNYDFSKFEKRREESYESNEE